MTKEPRICTEIDLVDRAASLQAAISENPMNVMPSIFAARGMDAVLSNLDAPFIAVLYKKLWSPGRTLRVAFLGDVDSKVKSKIQTVASIWPQHINLKLYFVSAEDADIRISVESGGSWSYVGTDAKLIENGKPTMNYGWLTPTTPDEEYSRVVLHEFGHALGAIHEHQHPEAGIPWDREKVYDYYAKMGWGKQQVDNNIFAKYARDQLNMSTFDRESIMHYAVPNELTIGDWEVGWNRVLSATDKQFMKSLYA